MIRESLTDGSRNAFMMVSGTQGWGFQRRIATGDVSYRQDGPSGDAPGWVRLVREGNLFSAYRSTDGTTWSLVGSDTISMASTVYVGVALTSHDATARATATFTNLTARTPTTGTNQPPTVSITGPASGATFTAPATITVTATASDTDGTITKVDFYRGTQLIGSDTTNSYSATATGLAAGTYQLTAVATDSDGVTRTSSPVSVTVSGTTNQAAHGVAHQSGGELDLHRPREHHPRRDGQRRGRHRHPRRFLSRLDAASGRIRAAHTAITGPTSPRARIS